MDRGKSGHTQGGQRRRGQEHARRKKREREKKEKSFSSAEDREKNTLKNKPIQ